MRIQNVSKLILLALISASFLKIETASAAKITKPHKKFIEILHTKKKEALEDPYFQLKSVKINELTEEEALEFNQDSLSSVHNKSFVGPSIPNIPPIPPNLGAPATPPTIGMPTTPSIVSVPITDPQPVTRGVLDSVIMVVDKLIAIGQKIMPTIKEGRSVVTNNPMTSVSVLPRTDLKDVVIHEMGGWSIPVVKHYKITYNNGLGMEVVSFVYSVTYQYNGSMNGKGKYLAGIRASARNIAISWGFDLDATSQLLQISNVGSSQDVVAGATIEMSYTVKNWTRTLTTNESFFISGDGKMWKLD